MMRIANLLLLTTLSLFISNYSLSQSSCSYIVHVDGALGTDNSGCGAEGTPCASINYGIGEAISQGLNDVRVKTGTYNEIVTLETGVNIWGGYNASWTQTSTSTINGNYSGSMNQYVTVVAQGVTGGVIVSDFTINAPDATISGKSSYGVHMLSSDVVFQNCIINGGNGANGSNGTNGTNGTGSGADGADGATGSAYNLQCNMDYVNGGVAGTGIGNTSGGNGGQGGRADTDCSGFPFTHNGSPSGGTNGFNAVIYNFPTWGYRGASGGTCSDGSDGNDGTTIHGSGGNGATNANNLVANFWVATTASYGSLGINGTGGGGGGGGGACDTGNEQGGGGGGGAAGGYRASTAGAGGGSGGNSAAIYASASNIEILNTIFYLGNGGNGGNGGASGVGAQGGTGGTGGLAGGTNAGAGGDGGDGANGGDSGSGGGGAAGSSYGMYLVNTLATTNGATYNSGTAGNPGSAGSSTNAQGTNGGLGSVTNVSGTNFTNNPTANGPGSGICVEIITDDLMNLQYCVGDSIWISYNAVGDFTGTNIFTAEMSDGLGSFASPTVVGTLTSMTSGIIPSMIPLTTPLGAGYKFRVISSTPTATGSESASIVVNGLPSVTYALSGSNPLCLGGSITLSGTGSGADSYVWDNGIMDGQSFAPAASGDYIVTGTNSATGCSNMDTVSIVVNLPTSSTMTVSSCGDYVSAQGNTYSTTGMYDEMYTNAVGCDSTVTIDLTVTQVDNGVTLADGVYTASGTGTYQWIDCTDDQPISGETGQTFTPTVNGDYAVQVTNGACVDTSACNAIFNVSIDELIFTHSINVHPNPTSGNVKIDFESTQEGVSIELVNISGQSVFSRNYIDTDSIEVNLNEPNGVYFIHIFTNDGQSAVIKVVKQD